MLIEYLDHLMQSDYWLDGIAFNIIVILMTILFFGILIGIGLLFVYYFAISLISLFVFGLVTIIFSFVKYYKENK